LPPVVALQRTRPFGSTEVTVESHEPNTTAPSGPTVGVDWTWAPVATAQSAAPSALATA
jgi:hypothetical protein